MLNYHHTLANEIFTLFAHAFESSFTELYILYLSPYFEFASNEGSSACVRACVRACVCVCVCLRYVPAFHMLTEPIFYGDLVYNSNALLETLILMINSKK